MEVSAAQEPDFQAAYIADFAEAIEVDAEQVSIVGVRAGSAVITTQVVPGEDGAVPNADAVSESLNGASLGGQEVAEVQNVQAKAAPRVAPSAPPPPSPP